MASTHPTTNGSYAGNESTPHVENGTAAEKPGEEKSSLETIGWYFVMKYYETLSQDTTKLHLFYNKKSQFVYGKEAEVTPILLGRVAIQQRISELNFSGSKVCILNVDSQPTDSENIVIQVIGDMVHKESKQIRKFVETFVLAKQTNGYFVLNDIFRYLNENEGEEQEVPAVEPAVEPASSEAVEEPIAEPEALKAEEPVEEPKAAEINTDLVDEKLESALASESAPEAPVTNGNGVTAEVDKAEEAPVAATKPEVSPTPEVAEKEVEEESAKEEEKPKEPSPTPAPVAAPPQAKPATPAPPAAPAKPLSWARLAAGAGGAKPVPAVPAPVKAATPPVQPRAAPPAAPAAAASQPSQPTPPVSESAEKESAAQSQGWQTAGSDQKRQARPQSVSSPIVKDDTLGYVRNVTEKVNPEELRATLAKYGEVVYFDVNRSKNCAFVEFASAAGYNAAAAANPHLLGGENIMVEPRRPKAAAYGGSGYNNNNNRGAMNNRGRGNYDQGRPGSQGGGRGGYVQRGGRGGPGGPGAARGTGQRPAATAA